MPDSPLPTPPPPSFPAAGLWYTRAYALWIMVTFSVLTAIVLLCSELPKDYTPYQYSLYSYDILKHWIRDHFGEHGPDPTIVSLGSSHIGWGVRVNDLARNLGYADDRGINASVPAFTNQTLPAVLHEAGPVMVRAKLWIINVEDYWFQERVYTGLTGFKEQVLNHIPFLLLLNDIGNAQRLSWMESSGIMPKVFMTGVSMDPCGEWLSLKDPRNQVFRTGISKKDIRQWIHGYYDNIRYSTKAFDELNLVLNTARQHQIPLVVIITPRAKRWNKIAEQLIPEFRARSRRGIEQWVKQNDLMMIDCQGKDYPCGVTDRDFSDPVHMNRQGARHFTAYLSERLKAFAAKK